MNKSCTPALCMSGDLSASISEDLFHILKYSMSVYIMDTALGTALTCFLEMKHQTRKRGHELFLKCAMWNVGEFLFCKMKNIILLRTKIVIIIPCKSVAIPKHLYEVHKPNSTNINHTEMLVFELEICL